MTSTPQQSPASPSPLTVLRGHQADVTDVKFAPPDAAGAADLLYSAAADGELRLWSIKSRRSLLHWPRAHGAGGALAVLPLPGCDAARFISQGRDGWLHEWDVRAPSAPLASVQRRPVLGFCRAALLQPPAPLRAEAAAAAAALSAAAPEAAVVVAVDGEEAPAASGLLLALPHEPDESPGARASSGGVSLLVLSSPAARRCGLPVLQPSPPELLCLPPPAVAPLGMPMALSVHAESEQQQQQQQEEEEEEATADPPGVLVTAAFESGHALVWRCGRSGTGAAQSAAAAAEPPPTQQEQRRAGGYEAPAVLAAGRLFDDCALCVDLDTSTKAKDAAALGVAGSASGRLVQFRVDRRQQALATVATATTGAGLGQCRLRRDSKIVVTAGWDHRVRLFAWSDLRPLAILREHTAPVTAIDVCSVPAQSNLIASGSRDRRIALWQVF